MLDRTSRNTLLTVLALVAGLGGFVILADWADGGTTWKAGQRCVMVDQALRATNCRVVQALPRGRVRVGVDVPQSRIRKPKPPKPKPTPTPSPSPSPTPSPSPSPTPEPTPTPTASPSPTPTPTPTPDPFAERFLAPTGVDAGSCTSSSSPCRTMGYAYQQAAPGDVVELQAGQYPGQTLMRRTMLDASTSRVVFKAAGADIASISFGGSSYDGLGAWHVELQDATVHGSIDLRRTRDVLFRGVRLNLVFGFGADQTAFYGGQWGIDHPNDGTHPEWSVWRTSDPVEGLTVDGVEISYIGRPAGREDVHVNAFHPWGDGHKDIVLRNSHLHHNDVFSMLVSGGIDRVTVEDNWFEPSTNTNFTGSAFYSAMWTGGVTNLTVQRNRFDQAPSLNQPSTPGLVACGNTGEVPDASWKDACP